MKLTDKKIDALNIELTIDIVKEDYADIEKKKFSQLRRTADFKGFRKGNVPESMIRRVYGDQVLVEAVNEVISNGLDEYIKKGKLHILGEPLSSESQPEITWKDGESFKFKFDLALSPEFEVEVDKTDVVNSYDITITEKEKKTMSDNLKKFYEEKGQGQT